ncbi:beta-lactamase-like protein [Haematococcus lacustris]
MASQVEEIKWLPSDRDRRFMVDGFAFAKCQPQCKTHFLTHFHSDHTIGLPKHFHQGTIYCSEVTAQLLLHDMGLQPASCVVALPMHTPVEVEGCRVTLVEANHCPGAVMLVVEVVRGRTPSGPHFILHTGDFRWADWMAAQVLSATGGVGIDTLFLDTTYCMPRYTFPPQDTVLDALADEVRAALAQEPASLLVVGAYHIGKEKVYLGLAKRLGLKVWVTPAKRRVLELLALPADDLALLTHCPADAQLHVSNWGLRSDKLRDRFLQGGVQGAAADPLSSVPPRASLADKGETGAGSAAADTAAAVTGGAGAAGDAAAGGAAAGGAAATAAAAAAAAATTAGAAAAAARVPPFEQELESDRSGADWGSWAKGPPLQQSVSSDGLGLSKEGSTGEEEVDMAPACAGQWRAVVAVRATGWPHIALGCRPRCAAPWRTLLRAQRLARPVRLCVGFGSAQAGADRERGDAGCLAAPRGPTGPVYGPQTQPRSDRYVPVDTRQHPEYALKRYSDSQSSLGQRCRASSAGPGWPSCSRVAATAAIQCWSRRASGGGDQGCDSCGERGNP